MSAPDFSGMREVMVYEPILPGDWLVFPSERYAQVQTVESRALRLHHDFPSGRKLLPPETANRRDFLVYRAYPLPPG